MSTREQLLSSIADTIQDYRAGDPDTPTPTPEHVKRWIEQFDTNVQLPMLREMDYVLKQTYFSRERVTEFLWNLINAKNLAGIDPDKFWRKVKFLNIQKEGHSQSAMRGLFNELLKNQCGFGVDECGNNASTFLYLDDGIFSGDQVRRDLIAWVTNKAPDKAKLHVIVIALHSGAEHHAGERIKRAASRVRKEIDITWWCQIELEARKAYSHKVDVLHPTKIPNDTNVKEYVKQMHHPPMLRKPGNMGGKALYTNDKGKRLLEQELLKKGAYICQSFPKMGYTQRPLGHMTHNTFGFGSLIVTYRNCPNNAPLALWIGKPWYPLFPRLTRGDVEFRHKKAHKKKRPSQESLLVRILRSILDTLI